MTSPSAAPLKPAGFSRFSSVHLLIAIAVLLISSPFVMELSYARVIEGLLLTAVLLSGLFAVSANRWMMVGALLAGLALSSQWLSFHVPGLKPVALVVTAVFVGLVVMRLVFHVLTAEKVSHETLCACIAGFLLIGILWTALYTLVASLNPEAFAFARPEETMNGFEAFYFSFVTLSTIGYGDITPVTRVARMLCVMEAVTGMFYVTVLIARLVSIFSSSSKRPPAEH